MDQLTENKDKKISAIKLTSKYAKNSLNNRQTIILKPHITVVKTVYTSVLVNQTLKC